MLLTDLLAGLQDYELRGPSGNTVAGLTLDSRNAGQQTLFAALRGTQADGHNYILQAVERGASVILAEEVPDGIPEEVSVVLVGDSYAALGFLAARFFDYPSEKLILAGVTGTNGKTSTATLLFRLYQKLGYTCGLLSTVENRIGEEVIPATHTTPDVIQLNRLLARMAAEGCTHVFMEVSSHAIHQRRIAGLKFRVGIFTNITHDHLDYHGTFQNYILAKKAFFDQLPPGALALVNLDDKRGRVMVQNTRGKIATYSLQQPADFKGKLLENSLQGLQLEINGTALYSRLIGRFNAYNLLAAYGCAILLGQNEWDVLTALSNLQSPEGRFDHFSNQEGVTGIVDYAHTPDALEKVLETINNLKSKDSKVIVVVGCGGDRDKAKRPVMAALAATLGDRVILTSDNPRTEDSDAIIEDMEAGVPEAMKYKVLSISNRKQAIMAAVQFAHRQDIILVAGKGHEKYQEINGERFPFDDKAILQAALKINV